KLFADLVKADFLVFECTSFHEVICGISFGVNPNIILPAGQKVRPPEITITQVIMVAKCQRNPFISGFEQWFSNRPRVMPNLNPSAEPHEGFNQRGEIKVPCD